MKENELNFIVDQETARQVWVRARDLQLVQGRIRRRLLRNVCFDTAEHSLRHAGLFLNLRREGRRWIQTIDTVMAGSESTSRMTPMEILAPAGKPSLATIPDISIRNEVISRVNNSPLQVVCETLVRRSDTEVLLPDGTRAELAVEASRIQAGEHTGELQEVILRLREGSRRGLFDLAHLVLPRGGIRFSGYPKLARGFLLAEQGCIEPSLNPRNAEPVALEPHQITEDAAREILGECLRQIATNVSVIRVQDDPEGPHQLRVGLRRLRSAFSILTPALSSAEAVRLNAEARWLGQEVGRLRDLDVLAGEIVGREAGAHPEEPGLAAVGEVLQRIAKLARGGLRELLIDTRGQAFLIDLARFVETRGWLVPEDLGQTQRLAVPITESATRALTKRWKKTRKRAEEFDALNADQRHELRKELKKLRYAVEFFAPMFPEKRAQPFLKRLKKLQTVFGEVNDAQLAKKMLEVTALPEAADPITQHAKGWIVGASMARAEIGWSRAKALWRDLEETQAFWK